MNQSIKTLGFPELTHCSDNQILLKDLSITLMHQLVTSNVGDCWCSFTCYNFPVDNQNCLGVGKISGPFFYKLFFKFLFYWNSVDSAWHQGLSLCSNHSDLRMFHKIVLKKLCCSQQILNVLKIISEIRLNIDILYLLFSVNFYGNITWALMHSADSPSYYFILNLIFLDWSNRKSW